MLIHNVYFWLRDDTDQAAHTAFTQGMAALMADPNVTQGYFGQPGSTPKRDVIDDSYDYGLILIFDDIAAHDRYQVGTIHDEFLANNKANFAKVSVFDIGAE